MSLKQCGHFFSEGSAGDLRRLEYSVNLLIGWMIKKKTTIARIKNAIAAFKKLPYINLLPLSVKYRLEKSGVPPMAAISGVIISLTSEVTMAPKAAPMTTATAKSTTFPRRINCLKSFSMSVSYQIFD